MRCFPKLRFNGFQNDVRRRLWQRIVKQDVFIWLRLLFPVPFHVVAEMWLACLAYHWLTGTYLVCMKRPGGCPAAPCYTKMWHKYQWMFYSIMNLRPTHLARTKHNTACLCCRLAWQWLCICIRYECRPKPRRQRDVKGYWLYVYRIMVSNHENIALQWNSMHAIVYM